MAYIETTPLCSNKLSSNVPISGETNFDVLALWMR